MSKEGPASNKKLYFVLLLVFFVVFCILCIVFVFVFVLSVSSGVSLK